MVQTGSHFISGLLFTIVVPRLMGPDTFGQYALITSVSVWFALVSGLSSAQTMSRFVPEFSVRGDREGLERFAFLLRLVSGALVAALYFALTAFLFRELDLLAVAVAAMAVFFRSAAKLLCALSLGLNQAARWGLGETVNRWASLILVIPGAYFGGLLGACLALLITELASKQRCLVGRPYVARRRCAGRKPRRAAVWLAFYGSNVLRFLNSGECWCALFQATIIRSAPCGRVRIV
jgi:O-antigen/teichoic acid export membrane protein